MHKDVHTDFTNKKVCVGTVGYLDGLAADQSNGATIIFGTYCHRNRLCTRHSRCTARHILHRDAEFWNIRMLCFPVADEDIVTFALIIVKLAIKRLVVRVSPCCADSWTNISFTFPLVFNTNAFVTLILQDISRFIAMSCMITRTLCWVDTGRAIPNTAFTTDATLNAFNRFLCATHKYVHIVACFLTGW